jgi:bifunctional non-homologous end joining protein LigD
MVPDYRPQLATLMDTPPDGDGWFHEQKFDGYRVGLRIEGGDIEMWTRGRKDWAAKFPSVAKAAARLRTRHALLDGEVAVVGPDGLTSFQALQNHESSKALTYFAFDLLSLDGNDLTKLPLAERKKRLKSLLKGGPDTIRFSEHVVGGGAAFLAESCRLGLEGMVSKAADAPYRAGRNLDWRKIKCGKRQEFVVGGFTEPEGSREGVGALLLAYYDQGRLTWAGNVGTGAGWTGTYLRDLRRRLEKLRSPKAFFDPPVADAGLRRNARWVRPAMVVEIAFTEWTNDGRIRHPSMQGIREDKDPKDIRREIAASPEQPPRVASKLSPTAATPKKRARAKGSRQPATAEETDEETTVAGIRITHPSRVLFSDIGVTKGDIASYYAEIATRMVPHVVGRPLTLLRCVRPIDPDVDKGGCMMIRHGRAWGTLPLRRVKIKEVHKQDEYLVADDQMGLVSLAQMGVVEIHTWNGSADGPYAHDRVVLDLDPGVGVAWPAVATAAHALRKICEAHRLRSWVKTTGGRGLHIVIPIEPTDWSRCLSFAKDVATELIAANSKLYTDAMPKAGREKKILIDVFRNNRTNTSVAAYSVRARNGATVSMPIAWEQLTSRLRPSKFNLKTARAHVEDNADPWAEYWKTRQRLP